MVKTELSCIHTQLHGDCLKLLCGAQDCHSTNLFFNKLPVLTGNEISNLRNSTPQQLPLQQLQQTKPLAACFTKKISAKNKARGYFEQICVFTKDIPLFHQKTHLIHVFFIFNTSHLFESFGDKLGLPNKVPNNGIWPQGFEPRVDISSLVITICGQQ